MSKIIILHGPQRTGKTANAAKIAGHYGCSKICDTGIELQDKLPVPLEESTLYITNIEPLPHLCNSAHIEVVHISQALAAIQGK